MNNTREILDARRRALADAFWRKPDGVQYCTELSSAMDETLRGAFAGLSERGHENLAILALGGYGRRELFPQSDVDVMVLIQGAQQKESASEQAREFLHALWDAGLNVGHSVRTIDEALAQHGQVLDSWIAMVESRLVAGNVDLANSLFSSIREKTERKDAGWLISAMLEESRNRQERFGSSVKLLEPNVKKSAGGLRDLHTVFWLYRGIEKRFMGSLPSDGPAMLYFLRQLHDDGAIEDDGHDQAVAALRFLFDVRTAMHLLREGPHDTLEYALQRTVAESLGYRQQTELRSVEVFMHDYYLHARTVHMLYNTLIQRFSDALTPAPKFWNRGRKVGSMFRVRNQSLALAKLTERLPSATAVFECFTLEAEEEVGLDPGLRAAIVRSAETIRREDAQRPECAEMFRKILASRRVAATLRDMSDTNILGRIIPEYADLVAFFQHNVYHYYTADEHTLIAIAHAEELQNRDGALHDVFSGLHSREPLYLALLLHDIAKPLGVADHQNTGVPIARAVVERLGFAPLADDVAFLVRNHLMMEQVAFRRNINDPATLKDFAGQFEKPYLLEYLYLLTYADMSAVNPNIWTEWKSAMLTELYERASEVLQRNLTGADVDRYHEARREEAIEKTVAALQPSLNPDEVRKHLRGIPNASYTGAFTAEEIGRHIKAAEAGEVLEVLFSSRGGFTDATIIARDAPFVLSRCCAVLAANDATIFAADIFTRDDGVIFDRFRVSDASGNGEIPAKTQAKMADDLRSVFTGTLDIDQLFLDHHRKWKRRPKKPANPNVRTGVRFDQTDTYTIVDVYAPDRVGFLYRVTEAMSSMGLDIYYAKIATRVDGIVDAFYILERGGKRIAGEQRTEEIRNRILATIRSMDLRELTGE